jgi:Tol biopolymer transport system component
MLNLADLLRVPQVDTGLRFDSSPDGQKVAFAWNKTGNWEIYDMSLRAKQNNLSHDKGDCFAASRLAMTSSMAGAKFNPRYSPDGKHLAYALDLDGSESYHVVLHNLQGDAHHVDLTLSSGHAQRPNFAFSPDGRELAVLSDERGQFALYLLSIETGEKRLLLDLHRPIWDVTWSPDGRWIAVEAEMEASERGVFVIEVEPFDTAQDRRRKWKELMLSPSALSHRERGLNAKHPAWSPDSRWIAFSAESEEWFDIRLYEIETGKINRLTQSAGDDTSPCWSRDGSRIGWVHAEGAATSLMAWERGGEIKRYAVGAGVHHHPQFISNDEIILIFESPGQPPDLWKLNLKNETFEQLMNSLPDELRDAELVLPEEITYESDGEHVHCCIAVRERAR